MNFIKSLFSALGRYRIINDREDNEPYLERYYIFLKERENFPFNIFIHKFLKSDPDELHDHPWSYFTFILWGGYFEHTKEGKTWYGPFSYRWNDASQFHRLELKEGVTCWTLFIPFKKTRNWGFMQNNTWVSHETYLSEKKRS